MTAGKQEEVTKEKEVGISENRHKRRENVSLSTSSLLCAYHTTCQGSEPE